MATAHRPELRVAADPPRRTQSASSRGRIRLHTPPRARIPASPAALHPPPSRPTGALAPLAATAAPIRLGPGNRRHLAPWWAGRPPASAPTGHLPSDPAEPAPWASAHEVRPRFFSFFP